MSTAIEVQGLRKSYGDFEAVAGVSFDVKQGEVFCLLGPNGAGKTSIVEVLEGYRSRTSGEVSVLGFDPAHSSRELRERVGIVLQECGVQEQLTVREIIEMYGRYYRKRRPVDEVIEIVELTESADKRAKELSGGQRRRLDVALGLVGDPDLIFLDEPTTGFDPAARRHAWSTVESLGALGKTIFLTTHYLDEAQALADRIVIVNAGQIIASGTPEDLGGRNIRPAEIRFALPDGYTLSDLPQAGGGERTLEQHRVSIITPDAVLAINAITGWALEQGIKLEHLSVSQPSLEDIYLELTAS